MKLGKFKLSQKDNERLAEMKSYCEDEISCRRKQFHDKFGQVISDNNSDATKFRRCEDMCDNCRVRNGGKRRGVCEISPGTGKDKKAALNNNNTQTTTAKMLNHRFVKASMLKIKEGDF